jgi:hypothetical protein
MNNRHFLLAATIALSGCSSENGTNTGTEAIDSGNEVMTGGAAGAVAANGSGGGSGVAAGGTLGVAGGTGAGGSAGAGGTTLASTGGSVADSGRPPEDHDAECASCGDEDGDGDPAGSDCDDHDAKRHHGAVEVCDAIDDDCDPSTLGPDGDGDGVVGKTCCNPQPGAQPLCGKDCDDNDGKVLPTAKEVCNGVDDDCNGKVDDGDPTPASLCSVTGQACTSGQCACPQGQSVCGTGCFVLGGACTAGSGGCITTGAIACIAGAPACNAVARPPTAEVCDGVDNDCNGQIDEGVKISCYPDGDNDAYAANNSGTDLCPNNSRGAFGYCPSGFVAASVSHGTDCNDSDPNQYRLDATSADGDGDGHCTGASVSTCVGAAAPPGRRFTSSCTGSSDCDDGNGGIFQTVSVRTDSDNDGFCSGGTFDQCTTGGAPGGTRLAGSCAGDDCKEGNPYAQATCNIDGGFRSNVQRKTCAIGPPPAETFSVATSVDCPTGFSPTNVHTEVGSSSQPGGNCTANNTNSVTVRCGGVVLGWVDCRVVADCVAN